MKMNLRKMLCTLLMIAMILSVGAPALAKTVKAKVSDSSAKFYKYPDSSSDHVKLEKGTTVKVSEVKKGWAKVKFNGVTGYMKTDDLESNSESSGSSKSSKSWKSKVVALKWFEDGKDVLSKGEYAYIYDIKSGSTIKIKRMGGHNHADIEPATKKDAKKLKKLGASWDARPVILKVDGRYIACSINTMPHGDQTITDNGFEGQICLHMVGSTTHANDNVRSNHQNAIKKAYNWAH